MKWLSSKLLEDGKQLFARGSCHEAIDKLNQAIKLTPGNSELYYERGRINQHILYHGLAISDLSTVIRLDPGHASAHALRGKSYQYEGKVTRALRDWKTAKGLGHTDAIKWIVEAEKSIYNSSTTTSSKTSGEAKANTANKSKITTEPSKKNILILLATLVIPGLLILTMPDEGRQEEKKSNIQTLQR